MSQLAEALGLDAVAELSRVFGGRRLFVPSFSDQRSAREARARLVASVGPSLAANLITYFAGGYVYVPQPKPQGRNPDGQFAGSADPRAVLRLSRTMTAEQIAQRLKCSTRIVYRIRAKAKPKP